MITAGTYGSYDQDGANIIPRTCLFALCEDGSLWMMKDPSGDESSEFWTQLPNPPDSD